MTTLRKLIVFTYYRYIYWITGDCKIERVRQNGTNRENITESCSNENITRRALTVDPQTQKMYWIEENKSLTFSIMSADMNGENKITVYSEDMKVNKTYSLGPTQASKDFIYWADTADQFFWRIPKIVSGGTDRKPKQIALDASTDESYSDMAPNYVIEEQTQGNPDCKPLESLLPHHSATNESKSLKATVDASLLLVNETKVSGDSRVTTNKLEVPVCHNYCLKGDCTTGADGQPKCR